MNTIYLDIGNTSLVAALKNDDTWKVIYRNGIKELKPFIREMKKVYSSAKLVVSSVRKDIIDLLNKELSGHSLMLLSVSDIPARYLDYETVQTLGPDRFIVCLGARKYSTKSVIVIDSGSATTIDFMDSDDVYRGGIIMPGLQILKNSFKNYLPELPLPEAEIPENWPGKSTMDCIGWGIYGMYRDAVSAAVERYSNEFPESEIFICGGDAEKLLALMGSTFQFHYNPFLLFEGMEEFIKQYKS